jgi:hypothetical protein
MRNIFFTEYFLKEDKKSMIYENYLDRIGYSGRPVADFETLKILQKNNGIQS